MTGAVVTAGSLDPDGLRTEAHRDALRGEGGGELLAGERLEAGDEPVGRLDHRHLPRAEPLPRLCELDPDHATAEHHEPLGHRRCAEVAPRLSQKRVSRSPSIGGMTAREPVASTTARVASSSRTDAVGEHHVDAPLADEPTVPAHERAAWRLRATPPGTCRPSSRRSRRAGRGRPPRRARPSPRPTHRAPVGPRRAPRPGAAAPCSACRPRTSTHLRRAPPRPQRSVAPHSMHRPGHVLADRPAADHDHVERVHARLLGRRHPSVQHACGMPSASDDAAMATVLGIDVGRNRHQGRARRHRDAASCSPTATASSRRTRRRPTR